MGNQIAQTIPALAGHTIFLVAPDCMVQNCPAPIRAAKHRPVVIMKFNNFMTLKYERHHPGKAPEDARMEPDIFVCPLCMPKLKAEDVVDDTNWRIFAKFCWDRDPAHVVPARASAVLGFSNLDVPNPTMGARPTQAEVFGPYEEERRGLNSGS